MKNTPNAVSTIPTTYLRCGLGSRRSGACSTQADRDHECEREHAAHERRGEPARARAERGDDQDHLDALEQHALERDRSRRPSRAARAAAARRPRAARAPRRTPGTTRTASARPPAAARPCAATRARRAAGRLRSPRAAARAARARAGAARARPPAGRAHATAPAAPSERVAPAPRGADGQHDRERLEQLEADRQHRPERGEQECHVTHDGEGRA